MCLEVSKQQERCTADNVKLKLKLNYINNGTRDSI